MFGPSTGRQARHAILVVNGNGARKKDYYENPSLSPNIARIVEESFVYTEDHCDSVASHDLALAEMLHGLPDCRYLHFTSPDAAVRVLEQFRPRILVLHETAHDAGHGSFDAYLDAVRASDRKIGGLFDWVRNHPYFGANTAVVIRPEFGRDDVLNRDGELHHSEGFYQAHRVARILWGPGFEPGVDRKTVINRRDLAPALRRITSL